MKKYLLFTALAVFLYSCSGEPSDEEMLQKDQEKLTEEMGGEGLLLYKLLKITVRSANDPKASAHLKGHEKEFLVLAQLMNKMDKKGDLSAADYLRFTTSYNSVREYVKETDEDIFPCFFDAMRAADGKNVKQLSKSEKAKQDAQEHALMCIFMKFGGGFGKAEELYECNEIDSDQFKDSKEKVYLCFFKGMLLFEGGLNYLAEKEFTRNIEWLEDTDNADFREVNILFGKEQFNKKQSKDLALAINYLFRGVDRMMMERKVDDERSLEDLEKCIELTDKIGLSNEITWSISAYVHIKKEEYKKAITDLEKLKKSPYLNEDEKAAIDLAIEQLKKEDAEGASEEGAFDKETISGIVSNSLYGSMSFDDWKKVLSKKKVPYGNGFIEMMETFGKLQKEVAGATDSKKLKEEGKNLWDKTKELVE